MDVIVAAEQRQRAAEAILGELDLIGRWSAVGRPVVVGATSYGLMVAPDLDLEIFCDAEPTAEAGFAVLAACAAYPGTIRAAYSNHLDGPDEGIYWKLGFRHQGEEWKVDMWALRHDHPGPLSSSLVEPMRAALTPESRRTILTIKQELAARPDRRCGSIHVYRAVLADGVATFDQFETWRADHDTESLTDWRP